jgi:hypothetical protein
MTTATAAVLKTINTLPIEERKEIVKQVMRTIRLEAPKKPPKKPRGKKNPENPSPSGDPWFDDPRNIAIVMEGIHSAKEEECVRIEDCPELSAIFSKYTAKYAVK